MLYMYYLIALLIIMIDQFTKWLVVKYMTLGESIPIIENFLYITSHRNRGAAWGILQGQMWFFYIVTTVVIIGIVFYIRKFSTDKLTGISLGLILGGAIGNFIDRIFRNEVVDFVHTYIFSYSFPVFNVADSALCIGVGLLVIAMFMEEKRAKELKNG
ncbi:MULTISPECIES: signal peptidase II [unclassified Bacillus (in: firmicutes)]|uniref:signal peptidase II n=1 Tax=unclassified Bacillus (in: firmicutes) TaxID=185979 RepID=UPI00080AE51C|nr:MULTISPECIES: signal peptidase II [unclassified Bacillus (in: firmicutes)]OCA89698.1 signal peptidase II [Bacillus sp. FJAT-27986]